MQDGDYVCDGLFLLLDTAAHMGDEADPDEIDDHIAECPECSI